MKIIIPVIDDKEGKNTIAPSFIHTDYVCIYDANAKSYEWIASKDITPQAGNLSIALKQKGIHSAICTHMSIMSLNLFIESGFKVLKGIGSDVDQNIKLFHNNELETLTAQASLASEGCSSSCSSCSSTCN